MSWLGVDPGLDGFLCLLTERGKVWWPMPVVEASKGRRVERTELARIVKEEVPVMLNHCVVERQQAGRNQSAGSSFKSGENYGVLLGVLASAELPYEVVSSGVWKRRMGLKGQGGDFGTGKQQSARKAASIALARQLFPGVDLRKSERCRVPHDGKAEALLLAEYARRRWAGGL